MTYKELMEKAQQHFDPQQRGIIKGYPVRVLYCISCMADKSGWDEQVAVDTLRETMTGSKVLDQSCVAAVLSML